MSIDVWETVVIERPIDQVAAFAGDPSNAPEWCGHVESATWQTEPPARLGSRIALVTRRLGRTASEIHEIVELSTGEQVAWRTTDGSFPTRTTLTWRPVGGRVTHMILRYRVEPAGISNLLSPLVRRSLRRSLRHDLPRLKRILES